MGKFAVSIRRPPALPLLLRQIAAKRGRERGVKGYVVLDLLRDCLIAYARENVVLRPTQYFEGSPETTVYVRGSAREHVYYLALAANRNMSLGQLLEAAIAYHLKNEIKESGNAN